MSSALVARAEYAALEQCVYLNQASLGLVPRRSTEAMVGFLVDVAQHGNARLSDADEERILDDLAGPRRDCSTRRCGRSRWWEERARHSVSSRS